MQILFLYISLFVSKIESIWDFSHSSLTYSTGTKKKDYRKNKNVEVHFHLTKYCLLSSWTKTSLRHPDIKFTTQSKTKKIAQHAIFNSILLCFGTSTKLALPRPSPFNSVNDYTEHEHVIEFYLSDIFNMCEINRKFEHIINDMVYDRKCMHILGNQVEIVNLTKFYF